MVGRHASIALTSAGCTVLMSLHLLRWLLLLSLWLGLSVLLLLSSGSLMLLLELLLRLLEVLSGMAPCQLVVGEDVLREFKGCLLGCLWNGWCLLSMMLMVL